MAALCINPGDTLPNLFVETDLGKAQLHDWRGQALVLYFYATACRRTSTSSPSTTSASP
jgi:peroxiredoxin